VRLQGEEMAAKKAASYKPEGFHSVTVYFTVQGVPKLMEFLKRAFGAEELCVSKRPDGTIANAQMRIGDSMVEMGEAGEQWKAMKASLHFYVPDVDAVYKRAVEAGGKSLFEVTDMPYGERSGGVADPCGNNWYIAKFMEELTEEEIKQRAAAMKK
jgi:PhnB protein